MSKNFSKFLPFIIFFSSLFCAEVSKSETNAPLYKQWDFVKSDEKKEKNSKEEIIWTESGRAELTKVPFFVRGKVKTNTEKYAILRGIQEISDETLYDAKAYFS